MIHTGYLHQSMTKSILDNEEVWRERFWKRELDSSIVRIVDSGGI